MNPSNSSPQNEDQVDFAPLGYHGQTAPSSSGRTVDLVNFTLANWKKLAAGCLAGLFVGVLFYLYSGPRYLGSTRLLVTKPPGTPLQEAGASTYGDTGGHVHLIKSHVIVERAMEMLDLDTLDTVDGSDDSITDVIDSLEVKRSAGQDRSFQSILDVSYVSTSKREAGVIASAVVDAYGEYLSQVRQENTQEVLDLFSGADAKLQQEIAALEERYQEFRDEAPILFTNPVGRASAGGTVVTPPNHYLQEVDRIRKNLSAARNRRTDVRAQQKVLREMIEDGESREAVEHYVMLALSRPSVSAGGDGTGGGGGGGTGALFTGPPAKERLDAELLRQKVEEAKLAHHIGRQHPAAMKTRKAINVILDAYRAQGLTPPKFSEDAASTPTAQRRTEVDVPSVYMKFLETQLQQLTYSEEVMAEELKTAIADARDASIYEVRDKQLADELERKKDLYNELVQRLEKLDLTKEQTGFRMQPISDVLVEKSVKRIIKIVGAFTILGGICVFGLLYFFEWRDMSMKSLDEVRRYANAAVLGAVPRFPVDPKATAPDGSGVADALCYYHRPGSREAEAFRSVRTSLFFSTAAQSDRIIQISSPEPGDGKTTSAANLATAVAQSGKRVLLVDGDLRRPTLHSLFGTSPHVGLSDVLRRDIEWINAVRPTAVDGLSIMTAGDPPPNPAELLSASDLEGILGAAKREFDYVFIDTPPVLAVSDPSIISPYTDGMLLVVRMNKNKRPAVVRTCEVLESHGVRLFGVVANDFEAAPGDGEPYHDYSSYYTSADTSAEPGEVRADSTPV